MDHIKNIIKLCFVLIFIRSLLIANDPIEYYLNNKIILCTGPSLNRYEMLKHTTEHDLTLIPFKKIFITTNDPSIQRITFNGKSPEICYLIPNKEKTIDCTNCIISTMRNAVKDPDTKDDDIILFKHESVIINDMHLIRQVVNKIVNEGYDMVNRRPTPEWGGVVTATDAFFVRVSAIRKLIENYPDLKKMPKVDWWCERFFHVKFCVRIPKVYSIFYAHNNGGDTELGFYHYINPVNPGDVWDKKNYNDIFNQ